ncbi:hypothetical protein [Campylobacter concisus]|uniref:hypothetical protein n=1 Tax=Campylobacter concisus TaxID=199 RepID=UPI000CD86A0C|nr:hypothetical protein [Campylobacter concisus]
MNYQDILNEKDENIVRIDRFIEFLKDTFCDLDQYNNEYGQLSALLEKEKRLYFELNKGDFNKILKEVKSVRQQIILKILVIKNKILNAFKEDKFDDKILKTKISQKYLDKILDSKIDVIKKELVGSEYFAYYLSDLQYKKADEIARIKGFANFLEKTFSNCECKDSRQSKILNLLIKEKKNRIEDIDVNNIKDDIKKEVMELKKEISASLSKESIEDKFKKAKISDEYISNKKEELFNKESFNIKKELLSNKNFEYYLINSFEQKKLKDHLSTFLKFHPIILSGVSLVGVICFFTYFGFKVRYFPSLSGSEAIYIGSLLFFIAATISIIIILPSFFYPWYYKSSKNNNLFYSFLLIGSMSIPSIIFYIFALLLINCPYPLMYLMLAVVPFVLSMLALKLKNDLSLKKYSILIYTLILVTVLVVFLKSMALNLLVFILLTNLIIPLCFLYLSENIYKSGDYKILLITFMFFAPAYSFSTFMEEIVKILEIGNIDYEYLTIDKSIAGALPKEIYDITKITPFGGKEAFSYIDNNLSINKTEKDSKLSIVISPKYLSFSCVNGQCKDMDKATGIKFQNNVLNYCIDKNCTEENATIKIKQKEHITYIEKYGDTIWLHNIKALSTLGKFYYLETKDGVKFELDSSKIISRQKQER